MGLRRVLSSDIVHMRQEELQAAPQYALAGREYIRRGDAVLGVLLCAGKAE